METEEAEEATRVDDRLFEEVDCEGGIKVVVESAGELEVIGLEATVLVTFVVTTPVVALLPLAVSLTLAAKLN